MTDVSLELSKVKFMFNSPYKNLVNGLKCFIHIYNNQTNIHRAIKSDPERNIKTVRAREAKRDTRKG